MIDTTCSPFDDEELTEAEIHASVFARSPIGRTGRLPVMMHSYVVANDDGTLTYGPLVEAHETESERLHRLYDCPECGPDQREEER